MEEHGKHPVAGIAGLIEARDAAILILGGTMGFSTNSEGFVTYDGNLTGRGTEHGFVAGLRIAW